MKRKVIIIAGPTATGKTSYAIEIAKRYSGVVINFDSLLFYKELSIGTAKPTLEEMQGVPHYLVGINSISDPLNANQFAKLALETINQFPPEQVIILVGGSGFYLQALLFGMYEDLSTPEHIRIKSDDLYEKEGIKPFIEILKQSDPERLTHLHENDHYRLRRAVEYFWTTGKPISLARKSHEESKRDNIHDWETLTLYFDIPKEEHYPLIQQRTKKMLTDGLMDEVKYLLQAGFTGKEKPMESIGYKEAQAHLRGDYTLAQCEEEIFIATRQLAKSQRTWFKGQKYQSLHPLKEKESILKLVENFLGQK